MSIEYLHQSNFIEEICTSKKPVFVEFTATWCDFCQDFESVFKKLSIHYDEKIRFAKIDVDLDPDITLKYDVDSLPTFILFDSGEVKNCIIGIGPFERFVIEIDNALNDK